MHDIGHGAPFYGILARCHALKTWRRRACVMAAPAFSREALMKAMLFAGACALALLSACATAPAPSASSAAAQPPAPDFVAMQSNLLQETKRLGNLVASGALTRVEAADQLNARRLAMIGPHPVDDEVFRVYRQLSVQVQQKKITQEKLRASLSNTLETARKNYAAQQPKPLKPPVFTNMLLQIYDRPPL
jgi:hypothetical protein